MYQQIVQSEVKTFQDRLRRCQMNCNEEAQDKVSMADMTMLSDSARDQLQNQVMQCNNKCFSQFREKVPALYSRIESQVDRHMKQY